MQTKYTDDTINRPEGKRVIDGPFVSVDFEKFIAQLKKEDAWKKSDRNSMTVYKTEGLTFVLTCLHKGASISDNSVEGFLVIQVLDGVIDLTLENNAMVLKEDQMAALHPGLLHTIHAKKESTLLLINKTSN